LASWQRGEAVQPPVKQRRGMLAVIVAVATLGLFVTVAAILCAFLSQAPEEVIVIGKYGPPKDYRWVAGEAVGTIVNASPDDPFTLRSSGISVMEVFPAPPWPHFRLEASVTHRSGNNTSRVGIVIAHSVVQKNASSENAFLNLTFADHGKSPGMRGMTVTRLSPSLVAIPLHSMSSTFPRQAGKERDIAVEFDGRQLRGYFGAEPFMVAETKDVKPFVDTTFALSERERNEVISTGSIGLYVRDAEAGFRNVTLKRLN
jgi:hypothetical protein